MTTNGHAAASNGGGSNDRIPDVTPPSLHPTYTREKYSLSTLAIHADNPLNLVDDVAPPLHVSTTFRYARNPDELVTASDYDPDRYDPLTHIYSRHTAPNSTRLELLLKPLIHAPCVTYASGLAALHALYVHSNPKRVFVTGGYHGTHAVLALQKRITNVEIYPLEAYEYGTLKEGDVVHIETPINPTGEAVSIKKYADIAHAKGAILVVDSTFGPPGLQEPFELGADVVMHSGTKYLGGHSDMLCGVLATRNEDWVKSLREERAVLGSGMGNMEAWLGVRSLRTLEVRVRRQSESATRLVQWLEVYRQYIRKGIVIRVQHASLQKEGWVREQMPGGYGPVFAIWMGSETLARRLPGKLKFFHHATSLGGVESLIEWRAMSDTTVDRRLLRVSVGLEAWWKEGSKSGNTNDTNGSGNDEVVSGEAKMEKENGEVEIEAAMKETTLGI